MQDYAHTETRQTELFLEECERRAQFHGREADWWLIRRSDPQPPVSWREQPRWPDDGDEIARLLQMQIIRHIFRGCHLVIADSRKNQDIEEGRIKLRGDILYGNADTRRERWYGAVAMASDPSTPDFYVYNLNDPSPEANYATRMEWRMRDGIVLGRMPASIFHDLTNHPRVAGRWVLDRCGIVEANFAPVPGRQRQVDLRLHPFPQRVTPPQQTGLSGIALAGSVHSGM